MKNKIIVFVVFSLFSFSAFSQAIEDIPLFQIEGAYMQIIGSPFFYGEKKGDKVNVFIDFGQGREMGVARNKITDDGGNLVVLNTMIDALNFMTKNGYDFIPAYPVSNGTTAYLIKKRLN
jgi:hypothetical protein